MNEPRRRRSRQVEVTEDLLETIDVEAERRSMPRTVFVRKLLTEALEHLRPIEELRLTTWTPQGDT